MRQSQRRAGLLLWLLTPGLFAQAPASPPTFQVNTRIVLTDVTVTDAAGHPVPGLPASAFHLYDNKRPQRIASFEEHTPGAAPVYQTAASPGVYSNDFILHPPPVVNVILIDTNTIPIVDQMYLYEQLTHFIADLPAGEPVAMYHRWGDSVLMLQSFTSDHQLLAKALRRAIPRLRITGHAAYSDFDTLQQLADWLEPLPGRKNVLWFTGGSNLYLLPDPTTATAEYQQQLSVIYDKLEAERIALYPIDARGLMNAGPAGVMPLLGQQSLMEEAARTTGGRAFYNNNGLTRIASRLVADNASYYTLSYSPDDLHKDNRWHRIKVQLDDTSYHLSYRRGYFDDGSNPAAPRKPRERTLLTKSGGTERVLDDSAQPIIFEAQILPASELPPPHVGQLSNPPRRPPGRGQTTYTVHFKVPIPDFRQEVKEEAGIIHVGAAVLALDRHGSRAGWENQLLTLSFSEAESRALQGGKFAFDQSINLPKGQDYVFVAVWDATSGRSGILQVPLEVEKPGGRHP